MPFLLIFLGILAPLVTLALQALLWLKTGEWPGWDGVDLLFFLNGGTIPREWVAWLLCGQGMEIDRLAENLIQQGFDPSYCDGRYIGVTKAAVFLLDQSVEMLFFCTGMIGAWIGVMLEEIQDFFSDLIRKMWFRE